MKNFVYLILSAMFAALLFGCDSDTFQSEMRSPQELYINDNQELEITDGNAVEIGNYSIVLTDTANQTTTNVYTSPAVLVYDSAKIESSTDHIFYDYDASTGIVLVNEAGKYMVLVNEKGDATGGANYTIFDVQRGVDGVWSTIEGLRGQVTDSLNVHQAAMVIELEDADSLRVTFGVDGSGTATSYSAGTQVEIMKLK